MKKETNGNSLESFKTIYIYQVIFGEQLPLCPSHYHDLPNKSLNFLFKQFDPYFHNIPFHSLIYKFKFYPYCEITVVRSLEVVLEGGE